MDCIARYIYQIPQNSSYVFIFKGFELLCIFLFENAELIAIISCCNKIMQNIFCTSCEIYICLESFSWSRSIYNCRINSKIKCITYFKFCSWKNLIGVWYHPKIRFFSVDRTDKCSIKTIFKKIFFKYLESFVFWRKFFLIIGRLGSDYRFTNRLSWS